MLRARRLCLDFHAIDCASSWLRGGVVLVGQLRARRHSLDFHSTECGSSWLQGGVVGVKSKASVLIFIPQSVGHLGYGVGWWLLLKSRYIHILIFIA